MNSPSPASTSSDDEVQEDTMIISESTQNPELLFGTHTRDAPSGSGSVKRRQPPGGFPPGPSYSAKNRRREEGPVRRTTGNSQWAGGDGREGGRTQKEELVDVSIVERLREGKRLIYMRILHLKDTRLEWGDPFDDAFVKSNS